MPIEVHNSTPRSFRAGDTVQWTKGFPNFKASDGWTLTYYFEQDGIRIEAASEPYLTDNFKLTLAAADSAKMIPGEWEFIGRVALSGQAHTVECGFVIVLGNLASAEKSFPRKMVENLRAKIEGRSLPNQDIVASNINGHQITRMSDDELRKWLNYYEVQVAAEEFALRKTRRSIVRPYFP